MGKKTAVFVEGQHVFAKVKGYSPWPAKVSIFRYTVIHSASQKIQKTGNLLRRHF
jgi:hypothetical protein